MRIALLISTNSSVVLVLVSFPPLALRCVDPFLVGFMPRLDVGLPLFAVLSIARSCLTDNAAPTPALYLSVFVDIEELIGFGLPTLALSTAPESGSIENTQRLHPLGLPRAVYAAPGRLCCGTNYTSTLAESLSCRFRRGLGTNDGGGSVPAFRF